MKQKIYHFNCYDVPGYLCANVKSILNNGSVISKHDVFGVFVHTRETDTKHEQESVEGQNHKKYGSLQSELALRRRKTMNKQESAHDCTFTWLYIG